MRRAVLAVVLVLLVAVTAAAFDLSGRIVDENDKPLAGGVLRMDPIWEVRPGRDIKASLRYEFGQRQESGRAGGAPIAGLLERPWLTFDWKPDELRTFVLVGAGLPVTQYLGSSWFQDPGWTPNVTRSLGDGTFGFPDVADRWRPAYRRGCSVRGAFQDYRSMPFDTQLGAAIGDIKYVDRDIVCVRYGTQCYPDLWRIAQPLRVAQASDASPPADLETQWALKRIGLPSSLPGGRLRPVTVAVIDSGLDWVHPRLKPENVWRNPAPGADPDYPNDVLGWDFVGKGNQPWDDFGHGTFVAGLIVAINPAARVMPVKVLDGFGGGPSSSVSRAIEYAVNRGARVLNVSLGSDGLAEIEQAAVDYARSRGAIVVVAAGNGGKSTSNWGPAGARGVLAVAATDQSDRRAGFGNWGQQVALAAPGVDVVSLRARWSDFLLVASGGKDYTAGTNIVGADRWLFRASGTSFAAPLVAGAASLLLSVDPNLTNRQVERMLLESADDIEVPGWDQFTGVGRLNVARALRADPNYYLTARVSRVNPVQEGGRTVVQVLGSARGSRLQRYEIQIGQGADPTRWKTVLTERGRSVSEAVLGTIPVREVTARGQWTIRLLAYDATGKMKEARGSLTVQ